MSRTIIYELLWAGSGVTRVGLTADKRGTYSGLIEKIRIFRISALPLLN